VTAPRFGGVSQRKAVASGEALSGLGRFTDVVLIWDEDGVWKISLSKF